MISRRVFLHVLAAALVVAVLLSTANSQPTPTARRTIFSTLKVGQAVTLKDKGGLYEIGTVDDAARLTHKIVEIGDDYIAVQDEVGVTDTRIPLTAVRAVISVKIKSR
jgi:cell shape-determining protein MreC